MRLRIIAVGVVLLALTSGGCRRRPAEQDQWGQGYERRAEGQQQPTYYEPDHGFLYYWFLFHMLGQSGQPTYHVYSAPYGYPQGYRPWMPAPTTKAAPSYAPTSPAPVTRSSGGFSSQSSTPAKPSAGTSTPRSSGGFSGSFSKPSSPTRSSGGFSGGSSSRSSGGFSGGRR